MKFERRQEAKTNPKSPRQPGEDPDIAGIVPGPQPPREDMLGEDMLADEMVPDDDKVSGA